MTSTPFHRADNLRRLHHQCDQRKLCHYELDRPGDAPLLRFIRLYQRCASFNPLAQQTIWACWRWPSTVPRSYSSDVRHHSTHAAIEAAWNIYHGIRGIASRCSATFDLMAAEPAVRRHNAMVGKTRGHAASWNPAMLISPRVLVLGRHQVGLFAASWLPDAHAEGPKRSPGAVGMLLKCALCAAPRKMLVGAPESWRRTADDARAWSRMFGGSCCTAARHKRLFAYPRSAYGPVT